MPSKTFYDLERNEEKNKVSSKRAAIQELKMESKKCCNNGDFLQELTLNKVISRMQKELDDYIVEKFPIRY